MGKGQPEFLDAKAKGTPANKEDHLGEKWLPRWPIFLNRCPDDCDANASTSVELWSSAGRTHDRICAEPRNNACRRDLRGRPSCGSHGGPDHRHGLARCLLEALGRPWLPLVRQGQRPKATS